MHEWPVSRSRNAAPTLGMKVGSGPVALRPRLCKERNQRIADLGKQRGMGDSVCYGGAIPAQILCRHSLGLVSAQPLCAVVALGWQLAGRFRAGAGPPR